MEKENPINPIYGYSLLNWLQKETKGKIEISAPEAEDWGWYSLLRLDDKKYMIGASVYYKKGDDSTRELEWVFQVNKQRSLVEKLLGKNKMDENDSCLLYFKSIFEFDSIFKEIEIS